MALQLRRGTAANRTTITPAAGELIYTTDTKLVYVGDGSTAGGVAVSGSGGSISDGDKGDITVSGSGATWTIDSLAVTNAKINDVAWSKVSGTPTTLSGYGITDGITSAAVAAGYQPLDSDLTAIAALTTTVFGRSLLTQADASAARTTLGAGTSNFDGAYASLSGIPSTFTPASHNHSGSEITSGTVDPARLGSGTSISTKFLRGDSTWQTISGGGDALTSGNLSQFASTTSAQLAGVISDETGSGALVFATSPTLVTPILGTPTSGTLTNCTGYAYSNLTGTPSTFAPAAHNHAASEITSGTLDITRIPTGSSASTVCIGNDARLSDARTPTSHVHGNITNAGAIGSTANLPVITTTSGVLTTGSFGTTANTFCQGDDSRLSDARTPTTHATSHQSGGGDPIKLDDLATPDDNTDLDATTTRHGLLPKLGGGTTNFLRADGTWAAPAGGGGGGATNVWVSASQMIPKTTSGCGVNSSETTTNDQNYDTLDFDTASDEFADFMLILPNNWSYGTVTARFYWTADSGSGTVNFALRGIAYGDDGALDQAAGTSQAVTDTLLAAGDMHITSATPAITIAGTPAANKPVQFTVFRDVSEDTLGVDARLIGVEIIYT